MTHPNAYRVLLLGFPLWNRSVKKKGCPFAQSQGDSLHSCKGNQSTPPNHLNFYKKRNQDSFSVLNYHQEHLRLANGIGIYIYYPNQGGKSAMYVRKSIKRNLQNNEKKDWKKNQILTGYFDENQESVHPFRYHGVTAFLLPNCPTKSSSHAIFANTEFFFLSPSSFRVYIQK